MLDGDPFRSYYQLEILRQLFHRLKYDTQGQEELAPCRYFDLIGGTGHGGLLAILLGRLHMTVSQAHSAYLAITTAMRGESTGQERLEGVFKHVLATQGLDEATKMLENPESNACGHCKTLAFSVSEPKAKYYSYPGACDRSQSDATIYEALLHLTTFDDHGPKGESCTVISSNKLSQPSCRVLQEAEVAFGHDAEVAVIVSIGTNRRCDSQKDMICPENDVSTAGMEGVYFQFVVNEFPIPPGDEVGHAKAAKSFTILYLERDEVSEKLDEVIRKLRSRKGLYSCHELTNFLRESNAFTIPSKNGNRGCPRIQCPYCKSLHHLSNRLAKLLRGCHMIRIINIMQFMCSYWFIDHAKLQYIIITGRYSRQSKYQRTKWGTFPISNPSKKSLFEESPYSAN